MNQELILALLEQAGVKYSVLPKDTVYEKFAELVVKECANHCDLLLDHKISSEWSRGTHDCSWAIKKHFGVEQ
jgi:hypothetical protein